MTMASVRSGRELVAVVGSQKDADEWAWHGYIVEMVRPDLFRIYRPIIVEGLS